MRELERISPRLKQALHIPADLPTTFDEVIGQLEEELGYRKQLGPHAQEVLLAVAAVLQDHLDAPVPDTMSDPEFPRNIAHDAIEGASLDVVVLALFDLGWRNRQVPRNTKFGHLPDLLVDHLAVLELAPRIRKLLTSWTGRGYFRVSAGDPVDLDEEPQTGE